MVAKTNVLRWLLEVNNVDADGDDGAN